MVLVDTDVLIDALRGREPSLRRVTEGLESAALATTAVTALELTSGARDDKQGRAIEDLLAALPILPFDLAAARTAAKIRRELEEEGRGIGMADYLIAGIAVERSLPVLTRNRKHFGRVPGLLLVEI